MTHRTLPSLWLKTGVAALAMGIAVTGGVMLVPQSSAVARAAPEGFADLVQQLQPAVVNVSTSTQVEVARTVQLFPGLPPGNPLEEFFRRQQPRGRGKPVPRGREGGAEDDGDQPITRESRSLGSGFIIDPAGYIVTNNHVITGEDLDTPVDKIKITLTNGDEYEATVVGRDRPADLALLKIDPKGKALPAVKFGDSNRARVGDWVLAIGNPFGLGGTVTAGIVSALHRGFDGAEGTQYDYFIQTDAAINRGNSGGPMFNVEGEVIGINSAIYSPSGGNVGVGFAIPSTYASTVIRQLREGGRVRRAWLGVRIQELLPEIAEAERLTSRKGALVADLEPGTPAAKAGVKPGDIIVAFNGQPVESSRALPLIVTQTPIGTTVDLDVLRQGKPLKLRVTLAELPGGDPDRIGQGNTPEQPKEKKEERSTMRQGLGLTLTPLTPEIRQRLKLDAGIPGVAISDINPASDAIQKGVAPGDVLVEMNGKPTGSVAAAAAALDEARKAGRSSVVMRLYRSGQYFFVGVKLLPLK